MFYRGGGNYGVVEFVGFVVLVRSLMDLVFAFFFGFVLFMDSVSFDF